MQSVGKAIRALRLRKDKPLAWVAGLSGVGIETVRRAELGKSINVRTEWKLQQFVARHGRNGRG